MVYLFLALTLLLMLYLKIVIPMLYLFNILLYCYNPNLFLLVGEDMCYLKMYYNCITILLEF